MSNKSDAIKPRRSKNTQSSESSPNQLRIDKTINRAERQTTSLVPDRRSPKTDELQDHQMTPTKTQRQNNRRSDKTFSKTEGTPSLINTIDPLTFAIAKHIKRTTKEDAPSAQMRSRSTNEDKTDSPEAQTTSERQMERKHFPNPPQKRT